MENNTGKWRLEDQEWWQKYSAAVREEQKMQEQEMRPCYGPASSGSAYGSGSVRYGSAYGSGSRRSSGSGSGKGGYGLHLI